MIIMYLLLMFFLDYSQIYELFTIFYITLCTQFHAAGTYFIKITIKLNYLNYEIKTEGYL